MGKATYLLSTGRVSTQNIYNTIRKSNFRGLVEHEPLRVHFNPRQTFRKPKMCAEIKRRDPLIDAKLNEIESVLARGERYVSAGWTTFTWATFLKWRFGGAVSFVGLVRNPYKVAASFLTHDLFTGARQDTMQRCGFIRGGDPRVYHGALGADWADFSPFEKLLFHWLEANTLILESCRAYDAPLYRFEELYGTKTTAMPMFYFDLAGIHIPKPDDERDAYNFALKGDYDFTVRPALRDACAALCMELGYSRDFVAGAENGLERLPDTYSKARVA
ncbi:hypothetical protein FIU97_06220 [Roseivivax sp. THAF40]|uniref:hypothetical protein n=1 Tax=unclassified Roseivivax TaxID=2639302 RepID=UPI0012678845|nr:MULTISPECIES: hypothetical protein [unclassified Roseivivax]QFS82398.1 hypothetical protein FIV09_06120 [Roseivivax sp. THAF197b]QFT46167.1 hypothetical protein FIU97_06220 [Roseivivax sp. THAF40]